MASDQLPTITYKIGATVYIISAEYSETATENAVEKIRRLLIKECSKEA